MDGVLDLVVLSVGWLGTGNRLTWFACLWLLLRFQWPHALGLAVVLWLACTLLLWPVLQAQVRRTTTGTAAALLTSDPHGFTRTRH